MATAEKEITCPMCGFKNPESAERCRSCGAKVEEISASYSEDEARNRRYQQEHFEMKWALVAAGVSSALFERERSGQGQFVGVSLLRSALTMQSARMIWAGPIQQ